MDQPRYLHEHSFEVRDYECDLQGVVNNAVYMHYLEHARHLRVSPGRETDVPRFSRGGAGEGGDTGVIATRPQGATTPITRRMFAYTRCSPVAMTRAVSGERASS